MTTYAGHGLVDLCKSVLKSSNSFIEFKKHKKSFNQNWSRLRYPDIIIRSCSFFNLAGYHFSKLVASEKYLGAIEKINCYAITITALTNGSQNLNNLKFQKSAMGIH